MKVELKAGAPPKPEFGAPCNGCGVCCALELCPLGILRFGRIAGPCPALDWDGERYVCGLLLRRTRGWSRRLVARWIAAGKGCDCRAEIDG
ncbi:MAG: hypothetical protein HY055_13170 [Magnetospirillum sp.]|nr:hypothetical protein [Magnetospirillum sp.]